MGPWRKSVRGLRLAALALAMSAGAEAHAQLRTSYTRALAFAENLEKSIAGSDESVGLAVAIVEDGQSRLVRGFGVREAGHPDPVTENTRFRIASLSKGFAGALAAMEVRDGRLSLSDPVARFVPEFSLRNRADTRAVTLEDILAHRVGLPPYAFDNLLEAGVAPLRILAEYSKVDPICRPGSCYSYQNSTFNMIATAIERSSGKAYADRVAERLLRPLGMLRSGFGRENLMSDADWARPHVRRNGKWRATEVREDYYLLPAAGGMNMTIRDLARWLEAQMGAAPAVLAPEVVRDITAERVATPAEAARQRGAIGRVDRAAYGLGWRRLSIRGQTVITHSGSVEGYYANITYIPDRRAGIAILANARTRAVQSIAADWLLAELGAGG